MNHGMKRQFANCKDVRKSVGVLFSCIGLTQTCFVWYDFYLVRFLICQSCGFSVSFISCQSFPLAPDQSRPDLFT